MSLAGSLRTVLREHPPLPLRLVRPRADAPPMAIVGVYRRHNVSVVMDLLGPAAGSGSVHLWALDEVAPELQSVTRGCGPGSRFQLLNRLIAEVRLAPDTWLVVIDDDVRFTRGSVVEVCRMAAALGLDLAQPGHDPASFASYPFVYAGPAVARETHYVEQGPCLVLSPRACGQMLPLPEDLGMGWGVEAGWSRRAVDGALRLGIVDAVRLRHLQGLSGAYDIEQEWKQMLRLFHEAGFASHTEPQRVVRRYWW